MPHTTPSKHQEQAKDVQEERGNHGPKHKVLGHKGEVEDVRAASEIQSLCKPNGDKSGSSKKLLKHTLKTGA